MTILWAGGEDSDFRNFGACTTVTTAGHFRVGYARCTIRVVSQTLATLQTVYWRTSNSFSSSNFWLGSRIWSNAIVGSASIPANGFLLRLLDNTDVVRLRLIAATTAQGISGNWTLQKVNAAGAATTLATTTNSFTLTTIQKFDLHVNYAVSGSVDLYIDCVNVLTYSGDVTTDSITALAGFDLGQGACGTAAATGCEWSEIIVGSTDTRSLALVSLALSGAGALSQWTGTANGTTVNEVTLSDADGIDTGTANNVSLFTQAGTIPANIDYNIQAVIVNARALTVAGQPQHMDLAIRQGGTVYPSSDKLITTVFVPYQNIWNTNPNTSTSWTATDLTTLQIGVKAIA